MNMVYVCSNCMVRLSVDESCTTLGDCPSCGKLDWHMVASFNPLLKPTESTHPKRRSSWGSMKKEHLTHSGIRIDGYCEKCKEPLWTGVAHVKCIVAHPPEWQKPHDLGLKKELAEEIGSLKEIEIDESMVQSMAQLFKHIRAKRKNEAAGTLLDESAKQTAGKKRFSLLSVDALEGIIAIREYGSKKYKDPESWKTVSADKYLDAAMRHLLRIMQGEKVDLESGLPHIDHALCNLMFISHLDKQVKP